MKTPFSSCEIILDSANWYTGKRITTMRLYYANFIHPEFMTHRAFSRNAASFRALGNARVIKQVLEDPAMPVSWGEEKRGMQAGEDVSQHVIRMCKHNWLQARDRAVEYSSYISRQGVHKQVANRLLAPFLKIQVIVTATEWDNFFNLRCHPDADPTMRELAYNMQFEYNNSIPVLRKYHIPLHDNFMASAGACARVSYLSEAKSKEEDIQLASKLIANKHLSPFEHQATAIVSNHKYDNFVGWCSNRNGANNFVGWWSK